MDGSDRSGRPTSGSERAAPCPPEPEVAAEEKGAAGAGCWAVRRRRAPAAELHAESAAALDDAGPSRLIRYLDATGPALVLGSHQPAEAWDRDAASRAGIEIARRRSGGGAVLVGPGEVLWVDIVIRRGDPLWSDDVGRATWWVGEAWAAALGAVGVRGAEVWRGPMRTTPWSASICFAGLGPGEVTVGGAKVVGVSQRRTPGAALFQTAALLRWGPSSYLDLLAAPPPPGPGVPADLAGAAAGVGQDRSGALGAALLAALVT